MTVTQGGTMTTFEKNKMLDRMAVEARDGKLSRRDFIANATLFGVTTVAATTAWKTKVAQAAPQKGGTFRIGVHDEDVIASLNHHRGDDTTSAAKALLADVTDIRAKDGDHTVKITAGRRQRRLAVADDRLPPSRSARPTTTARSTGSPATAPAPTRSKTASSACSGLSAMTAGTAKAPISTRSR
jgi:hypothetical protein